MNETVVNTSEKVSVENGKNAICILSFGSNRQEAQSNAALTGEFGFVNNPNPTGDHWKVINLVVQYFKRGDAMLPKTLKSRRDFTKTAAQTISMKGNAGFCMEIASVVARKFRDDHGYRMQRGKVYAFVIINKDECVAL